MWGPAVIVYRETLEAALFVGIVAAATRGLPGRTRWLSAGVAAGALGALLLALGAGHIAAWADGLGQDLVNVLILSLALVMLVWHCTWMAVHGREMAAEAKHLGSRVRDGGEAPWAVTIAVALAVLREGAETVLFVMGLSSGEAGTSTSGLLLVAAAGLAGGIGTGALLFLGLARIPTHRVFQVTNVLVLMLAGAMASQLARALTQGGWLRLWTEPVWDSSEWLSSSSTLGTLLHSLVGYDDQPSGAQILFYAAAVITIVLGMRWAQRALRASRGGAQPAPRTTAA